MIKIIYKKKEAQIYYLDISGHANFGVSGKDIVCAGVSSLVYAGLNSLNNIKDFKINIKEDGRCTIECLKDISSHDTIVLEVLLNGFKNIQESYPSNLKIIEKE